MQHNSGTGRYVRNAPEEQVQCNATPQCNTKNIFKLKPKCNAMQHSSATGRYLRNASEEKYNAMQCNAMQQSNTKDILELKPRIGNMRLAMSSLLQVY